MLFSEFCFELFRAALSSDFGLFKIVIEANPDYSCHLSVIYHDKSRNTLAHIASSSGCVDILRYIAETCHCRSLLTKRNSDGKTPLHVAAQMSHVSCVEYLIPHVMVDELKRGDWTPLMLSCTKDNLKIVEILLEAGANPQLINKDGWNSLHIACREGHAGIIKCLLVHDPSLWKTKSKNGRTPLHTAALHGQLNAVKLLLAYGSYETDEADSCGITPLMDAASSNHVPVIKLLMEEQKASLYAFDVLGRNVLHFAAQAGSISAVKFLVVDCNMDVKCKSYQNLTPLDFATKENHTSVIEVLSQF